MLKFRKNNIFKLLFTITIFQINLNALNYVYCEKSNSKYTGWISEGLSITVNNETALSECKMLLTSNLEMKDLIQVSYSCKNNEFISYFGANNEIINHGSINYMDEIQTLKIGCSDGYSYVSFGGSRINQYNNTNNGFPIITTSLNVGFTNGGIGRIPSLIIMEGYFSQINSFSIRRRVATFESTNSRRWSGEHFTGGCFALLPIPQPGNIIYSIVGIGFISRGIAPKDINYSSKGINIKNMIFKVGKLFSECQTLHGPELDHKNNSTTFYSIMCPNGYFHKFRTYKKYSLGTTTLASIEIECKDYGIKIENSIYNSIVRFGEHKGGPWISNERIGNLTAVYTAYLNSVSKSNCKGSNTCNPIALRYYDNNGKEFSTFLNTEFSVQRLLKKKTSIKERVWVGNQPTLICAGINKNGYITSIGIGYKNMIEPTPLFIDAIKMVKPEIIFYPISLQRNQTINTAISYNPNDVQISFLSSKVIGCNNSYSPNKNISIKNTIQVHAQCKYNKGSFQYINKLILFVDNITHEIKRIAGICSNNNIDNMHVDNGIINNHHNNHMHNNNNFNNNNNNLNKNNNNSGNNNNNLINNNNNNNNSTNNDIDNNNKLRLLKEEQKKIINMFDKDKWPINKWAPSPFRVQHESPYKTNILNNNELYQNSLDLSFAFGQSISSSIKVISSESGPFNSIYLGYNTESSNPIMLTTKLNELNLKKKTLLMHYSSYLSPSTITYWEIPTVNNNIMYTDSICVELEQRNGNIVGIGFEGSMSSVPYESLDDNISIIKSVIDENGNYTLEVKNNMNNNNNIIIENYINNNKCPKLAHNQLLIDYLENIEKNNTNNINSTEVDIGTPFTITCPNCTEIEFIKTHYIIDGPIIGLEWKCTGLNEVETLFIGGRSPSQMTTQIFNKVRPKMIELAFNSDQNSSYKQKNKSSENKPMPGPSFFSIDGYVESGKIQQLLYYRMKNINLSPTITWENDEQLKSQKHVLRTICGRLSSSQAILSLGFGFEYLPLECSKEDIKSNLIPIDNQYTGNTPSIIINGPRISQKVDSMHPNCSQIQGGSARTRLSNWLISFSCLDDQMKYEIPFSKLTALRTNSKNINGLVKVLTFYCPDQKSSVSIGENDIESSQLIAHDFDLTKPGSSLVVDFSPLIIVPTQVKLNPPYSASKLTTVNIVSGFNEISTNSDSIYGVCFELTSDGKIAGIAFANKPSKNKKRK